MLGDSLTSWQGIAQGHVLGLQSCVWAPWQSVEAQTLGQGQFTHELGWAALLAMEIHSSYSVETTEKKEVAFLVESRLPQGGLCLTLVLRMVMGARTSWGLSN